MRIVLIGNGALGDPLRRLGHDVLVLFEEWPELAPRGYHFDLRPIWKRLRFSPDVLLVADTLGQQTLPYGLEDIDVPRVYWAIDIHVNHFWQRHYGALFDLVLVAQKDWVPLFTSAGIPARWLPYAVDDGIFHDQHLARVHDVVFVGTVDGERPKRAAALELLGRHCPLTTFGTRPEERLSWIEMGRVLSSAKIALNESILGEVTFRTFEAMACGAMLLTERIGNGLDELFTPGVHLDTYEPTTLIEKVQHYLAAPDERARIASAGQALVRARHTMLARMTELTALLEQGIRRRATPARSRVHWGLTAQLTVLRGLADSRTGLQLAAESLRDAAVDQGDAEAGIALAEVMAWAGRDEGALALLAGVRNADATNLRAWLLAGEIERRRGRPDAAAALLRAGLQTLPLTAARADALAAVDEGVTSARCWHALGVVVQEAGLPLVTGLVRNVTNDLPRTAFDYYKQALQLDPHFAPATRSMAVLLELAGVPEFAVPLYEGLVRAAPADVETRGRLAIVQRRSYLVPQAAHQERVIAALCRQPIEGTVNERAAAEHEAAGVLRQAGAAAEARAAFAAAAGLVPDCFDYLLDCALACAEVGDLAAARAHLARAAALRDPDERIARLLTAFDQAADGLVDRRGDSSSAR